MEALMFDLFSGVVRSIVEFRMYLHVQIIATWKGLIYCIEQSRIYLRIALLHTVECQGLDRCSTHVPAQFSTDRCYV